MKTKHPPAFAKASAGSQSISSAGLSLALGASTDITERKKAAEALQESERRLSLANEEVGIGLWLSDPVSNDIWASERGLR